MYGDADRSRCRCNGLSLVDIVTRFDHALGRFTNVLLQWQYQSRRDAGSNNRGGCRDVPMPGQLQTTVERMQPAE